MASVVRQDPELRSTLSLRGDLELTNEEEEWTIDREVDRLPVETASSSGPDADCGDRHRFDCDCCDDFCTARKTSC